jgi:c-di-GMP-binding flagellar brake protein YcgR
MFQDTRPAALGADGGPDAWADFRVTDRAEQLRLLRQLSDGGVPVTLSAPVGMAVSVQLWSVDAAQRQLSFSADAHGLQMQQLAHCDEAVAVAYLDSVKLQFELGELMLVHGRDSCALRTEWPAALYRFQRRASFRVRTLERRAPQARLRHPSMPEMLLSLRIVDVSVGGLALVLPDDVPALQPGSRLGGVRIELDGDTAFDATLRLQHVSAVHGGGHGMRLGCEFVELEGQAQRSLQRYIDQTQQRRRLLAAR